MEYGFLVLWALAAFGGYSLLHSGSTWLGRWRSRPGRKPTISILLWVRNQADTIEGLLRLLLSPDLSGWQPPFEYDVVVVDDGSTDETCRIVQNLAVRNPALRVLRWSSGDPASPPTSLEAGYACCVSPHVLFFRLHRHEDLASARQLLEALFGGSVPSRHTPQASLAADVPRHDAESP